MATQVVLINAYGIIFPVALSISVAANVRVGNLLGAGEASFARRAAVAALQLSATAGAVTGLSSLLGRDLWPRVYAPPPQIMQSVKAATPIFAFVQVHMHTIWSQFISRYTQE